MQHHLSWTLLSSLTDMELTPTVSDSFTVLSPPPRSNLNFDGLGQPQWFQCTLIGGTAMDPEREKLYYRCRLDVLWNSSAFGSDGPPGGLVGYHLPVKSKF